MESLEKRKAERAARALAGPDGVVIEADKKGSEKDKTVANPNQEGHVDPVYNKFPGASQIPDTAAYEHVIKGDDSIASSQSVIDAATAAAAGNGGGAWDAPAKTTKKTADKA